jgi:hypothetical protein
MDVDGALARLGLGRSADLEAVKRQFRRLAHDHHPDRGGDSARFAALESAYRMLLEHHEPRPTPPRVAQGRPSREPTPADAWTGEGTGQVEPQPAPDPLSREELQRLRTDGARIRADATLLARLLVTVGDAAPPARLRPLTLRSRAPGARSNGLAALLSESSSSALRLCDPRDLPRSARPVPSQHGSTDAPGAAGSSVQAIVLLARGRAARRAVDRLELDARRLGTSWRRERGDTTLRLQTTVEATPPRAAGAAAVVRRVDALLTALEWPLPTWSLDVESLRDRA